jgi:bifunctional non-homologous end joining protein LigD
MTRKRGTAHPKVRAGAHRRPPAAARTGAGRLAIVITHPDKVFWPEEGYTKRDLATFYTRVFPRLRPYVKDRLQALERCPDGMRGECFYQREAPPGMPPGTPTKRVRDEKGTTTYVVGGLRATQLALVNLGCIACHVWGSRAQVPERPDWVCFDIDPPGNEFAEAARAGRLIKEALDALGLVSFPKTSGGRGLHVFVPIRVGPDTRTVLAFAEAVGRRLAAAHPTELTVEAHIAARRGRTYLDPFRNAFAQTVVAPFSVRRRPRAPVSTPLAWSEVTPTLIPSDFNLGTVLTRLGGSNPWKDFFRKRQSLDGAIRRTRDL